MADSHVSHSATATAGNYRSRIKNISDIKIRDLQNPWNFFAVLNQDDTDINNWLMKNKLMISSIPCTKELVIGQNLSGNDIVSQCSGTMKPCRRAGKPSGATLRCSKNRNHEVGIRTYSFFEGSKLTVQDIFMFVKCYLDGLTLLKTSMFAGVAYRSTGVDWASFTRELFKEHFHRVIRFQRFSGDVEIDESLFGRGVKYHRGNPNKGLKVWVFGIVERSTNRIILYPVENRSTETLIPLIQRHVESGATIYSDGWTAYCSLNELGYRHFTVLHKYTFKKLYKNTQTGEITVVHTNRIEGAWKHAKDHFRTMAGTKAPQWEGHLAEIMWRSQAKSDIYKQFFDLLTSVYTLEGPPQYFYTTPLFDSWSGPSRNVLSDTTIEPEVSDADSDTDVQSDKGNAEHEGNEQAKGSPTFKTKSTGTVSDPLIISSDEDFHELRNPTLREETLKPETVKLLSELFSGSSSDEKECNEDVTVQNIESNTALQTCTTTQKTSTSKEVRQKLKSKSKNKGMKKKTKTDNVCHPEGFEPLKKNGKFTSTAKALKSKKNPYDKTNFLNWSSSDDDFV